MYNREKAVEYAHKWAFGRNPMYFDFENLGGDCTNFASQVIYAGCPTMNYTPVTGWYYIDLNNRAPAWTGVNELYRFLTTNQSVGPKAFETILSDVEIGDIIQLDFNINTHTFDHSPVVVNVGERTPETILLAAHTNDSDFRPLSTYPYERFRVLKIYC